MWDKRHSSATKIAQSIMALSGANIVDDGLWGKFTQATYDKMPSTVRDAIDAMLASAGMTAASLARNYADTKSGPSSLVSEAKKERAVKSARYNEMLALIDKLSGEEGVPLSTSRTIFKLENPTFDPKAVSPTGFKGMGQLGIPAITDAIAFKKDGLRFHPAGRNKFGPLYNLDDVFDPEQNIRTALRYMRRCAQYMNVPIDDVYRVYMAYNIGAGAARSVLAGRLTETARTMIAANPAYNKRGPENYASELQTSLNRVRSMMA